jgi:regulation of enolase protein 1 (concanavalin A-like superfamily)
VSVRLDGVPFPLEWAPEPADWSVERGRLVVRAPGQTDWFVDPVGGGAVRTAPLLLGAPPAGDFTLEAHVALDGDDLFDAAGLFVHAGDDHWAKLALEVTGTGPTIVSVVTDTTSDDCNSTVLARKSVRLRVARLGEAIAFHADEGAGRWELVRVFRLGGGSARVGVVCQAPTGAGCTGAFDAIAFEPRSLADIRDGS